MGGGKVGLITGCFDVLHIGHVRLFKWAKKRVDLLIVGLDSDGSIRLSKGTGRPIFSQKIRLETLSQLSFVDYIFGIRKILDFFKPSSGDYYSRLSKKIAPDYLITHLAKDKYADEKIKRAGDLNIGALIHRDRASAATTEIVEKINRLE